MVVYPNNELCRRHRTAVGRLSGVSNVDYIGGGTTFCIFPGLSVRGFRVSSSGRFTFSLLGRGRVLVIPNDNFS